MTLCDSTSEEDVVCSDPETYRAEHLPEEEPDEDPMALSEEEVPGMTEAENAATGGESDIASDPESE